MRSEARQDGRSHLFVQPQTVQSTLARQVVARLEHSPHRNPRHYLVVDAPEQIIGRWDGARLDQVLTNLIANALKYSPAGGEVRAAVRRSGAEVVVAVSDRGVGITPESQRTLFQPFSRGDATERAVPGVGLGLYIAAQIVQQHGGALSVQSEPGQGSVFTVRLPLGPPIPGDMPKA